MSYERYFCNVIFSTFSGGCHIDWGEPFFFIIIVLFFRRGGEKCRNNGGFLGISILFAVGFGPEKEWHSVFFIKFFFLAAADNSFHEVQIGILTILSVITFVRRKNFFFIHLAKF